LGHVGVSGSWLYLHLLFDSGLRSREVCGLKLTDFDRVHQHFTVTGKGNKKRTLPYSPELRQTLAAYFKSEATPPRVYLFENRQNDGTPITVRGVQYIVKEVLKRSKLKQEVLPHTFRHSFAVHHINNGGFAGGWRQCGVLASSFFLFFYFILFYFILFYFILFYFILFYFILFYFILFFVVL
jgi:integrase